MSAAWLWVLAGVLLLCACSNRVTTDNFDKIANGMPKAKVIALLGQPDSTSAVGFGDVSGSTYRWEGSGRVIVVVFANGKVAFKTFGNGQANQ